MKFTFVPEGSVPGAGSFKLIGRRYRSPRCPTYATFRTWPLRNSRCTTKATWCPVGVFMGRPREVSAGGEEGASVPPSDEYEGRLRVTARENGGLLKALLMNVPMSGRVYIMPYPPRIDVL